MSYYTKAQETRSEKIVLCMVESVERLKIFNASGADWTKQVDHYVVGVKDSATVLTSWTFDPETKTLTIIGGADPKTRNISVTYKLFFSNSPVILPNDLATGADVEWEPYIVSIGAIGQQLDEQSTGIVLESSSNVDFINSDGRFDDIFDALIWENQSIKFYSWIAGIPISERVLLFDGLVESKEFSESKVTFRVKDFVFKLRNQVNLGTFSDSDGEILPAIIGTPKRRIYGQVDNVRLISTDATLQGYDLSGTVSVLVDSASMTGSGTSFLSEVSPSDELFFIIDGEEVKIGVQSVESDTALTLGKVSEYNISALAAKVKPAIPYRGRNRSWHITGHKLRAPSVAITAIEASNIFTVTSVADFYSGDEITVNSIQAKIRRISGLKIITESSILPAPSVSQLIAKRPVQNVYFGKSLLIYSRDYLITNTTEAKIEIDPLAEFNITEQRSLGFNFTFTNGSRSITTAVTTDLKSILKSRDWIRSSNISKPDWYEILEVKGQEILIRTPFTGATATEGSYIKNVIYMDENSPVTCGCLGYESSGVWMKTPSDAVRHLVLNDAGFSYVNETSFTKAKSECNYILSMVIPETIGDEPPTIRDIITKINESVFGSLYGDSSQAIAFSILNSTKPVTANIIKDDDIINFSISSSQKIVNKVIVNYRPYVDVNSDQDTFLVENHDSSFVDNLIGISNTHEKTIYLYETDKAKIIAQRLALFNSLSNSIVKIKTKLNLAQTVVGDKIYLSLDRLYKRFGGDGRVKLGTVTGIKKDGYGCEISISDLSNIYNRVLSIAPNSTLDYSSSSEDDYLRWGFILDDSTETPDASSETGLGSNIIG